MGGQYEPFPHPEHQTGHHKYSYDHNEQDVSNW
jgi:hypothetical protein